VRPPDVRVEARVKIVAEFIRSAAGEADLPNDGLGEIALVGRSNVGKSSLINALVRRTLARTSSTPGKTRLTNVYRVQRGAAAPCYLVDLPGFGFARGDRTELEAVARAYFGARSTRGDIDGRGEASGNARAGGGAPAPLKNVGGLLLIDSRHPGLRNDVEAWNWLQQCVDDCAVVATKIDKLSRSQRQHAIRTNEAVFDTPVLPVSAATGEGLDELWKLIERLLNSSSPRPRTSKAPNPTAPPGRPLPRKNSSSRR